MTKAVRIVVEGDPVPKQRPRFGNGRTYTPAKTRAYEDLIGLQAKLAMQGEKPWTGPVNLTVTAYLKTPKKPKNLQPIVRFDIDNIIKSALDGCNGIAFEDDAQVVHIVAQKQYSPDPALIIYMVPA